VPDPRLHLISKYIETKKIVAANIDLVDIPAIVTGASTGEGLGNKFLEHVRQVDALAHIVRCFDDDDIIHVEDNIDPIADAEAVEVELILADLQVLESARDKAARRARTGDKDAKKRIEVCDKGIAILEDERTLKTGDWSESEVKELHSLGMITMRPTLYIANIGEDDLANPDAAAHTQNLKIWVQERTGAADNEIPLIAICAKLEAELAEIEGEDQKEMLEALDLDEPGLAVVARGLYALLGLQSFYTAGIKEVRAWTIRQGQTAPEAAGVIHSDLQRGFIRCETYHIDDLVEFESEKAVKHAGKIRSEGKHYIMQDGDVCHILFST